MRKTILGLVLLLSLVSLAQDKVLSIRDAIVNYALYPSSKYQMQWLPGSEYYSELAIGSEQYIKISDAYSNKVIAEIRLTDINEALKNAKKDSLSRVPFPVWIDANTFGFNNNEEFLAYNYTTKSVKKRFDMKSEATELVYTTDITGYAGLIENGFAYQLKNYFGTVTSNTEGIVVGTSVHRNEFGIHNGLFFSPNGSKLAYYHMDERMVTEYPLYELNETPAKAKMIRYPTAGAKSHHVSLRIKSIGSSTEDVTIKVTGPEEQYLTNISWMPDNEHVLIAIVNREQNHMWLNQYNSSTGEFVKTIFEETHPKYIEPEHPAQFLPHSSDEFIWWSERDGYDHLYLYSVKDGLKKQLTSGEWVVTDFHGFNKDGDQFFISANKENPLSRDLYCVDMKKGKMKRLTSGSGVHNITANTEKGLFIDNFSAPEIPRIIRIISESGKEVSELLVADNPLAEYKKVELEMGSIKGPGGQDLYYRLFKPADFDPTKKYPAVVYLYNGPHLQLITNSWQGGANHWYHYMAQNGYVVYSIDGRGSMNRGRDFENAVHRDMGAAEMEDQLAGLDWLKNQSFVDSSRVGIHGWSYGGYMTISLMTRTPGKYKVGIAGGPVIDWKLYEVMYTERYMDSPEENPEGYERTDLKNYIKNLQGDLLIIHGGQDNVVLWQHSLQYLEKAIKDGVQLDYFVYPHHEHNVLGRDRVHLYEKVSNYFFDKL